MKQLLTLLLLGSLLPLLTAAPAVPAKDARTAEEKIEEADRKKSEKALPKPDETVVYKQAGGEDLKLFVFYPDGVRPTSPKPLMLMYHGGGWRGGDPTQFFQQCRDYNKLGMVAISASYRLSPKEKPQNTPFDAVLDARSAIRYIKAHATDFGIDPDKIVTSGSSAGGHLAIGVAVLNELDDPADDKSISSRPAAVVLLCPVVDAGPAPDGYKHIYKRLGDKFKPFSPIHNLTDDLPPQLLIMGDKDSVMTVKHAGEYKAQVEAKGGRCDLVVFPGVKHGAFYRGKYYEQARPKIEAFLRDLKMIP